MQAAARASCNLYTYKLLRDNGIYVLVISTKANVYARLNLTRLQSSLSRLRSIWKLLFCGAIERPSISVCVRARFSRCSILKSTRFRFCGTL